MCVCVYILLHPLSNSPPVISLLINLSFTPPPLVLFKFITPLSLSPLTANYSTLPGAVLPIQKNTKTCTDAIISLIKKELPFISGFTLETLNICSTVHQNHHSPPVSKTQSSMYDTHYHQKGLLDMLTFGFR